VDFIKNCLATFCFFIGTSDIFDLFTPTYHLIPKQKCP